MSKHRIGAKSGLTGRTHEIVSPVTGRSLASVVLASRADVATVLERLAVASIPPDASSVFEFLKRLRDQLVLHKSTLLEQTTLETGFILRDSQEIVDGAIEFLTDFQAYVATTRVAEEMTWHSYSSRSPRATRISSRPFECVAAVVPQNASLTLGIIIVASALYAGSRVVLRPSLQCAGTGALLAELVRNAEPPTPCIEVINCLADDFLEACYSSPTVDLIHYIGSNQYALSVFTRAFEAGKTCLVDGQGNGLLYLDDSFPLDDAVQLITSGATRFNGQTCTSVNGVLVDDSRHASLRTALVDAFSGLVVGQPLDAHVHVGPLFSAKQAEAVQKAVREARILCGGKRDGAYFYPTIVEGVGAPAPLVREGVPGPLLWLQSVEDGNPWEWFRQNRFPLSDTILSRNPERILALTLQSKAARICVNADPSIESMFEPWGGYPPSGANAVSRWVAKYTRAFQLDGDVREITAIPPAKQREAA